MNIIQSMMLTVVILIMTATSSEANWLIYHEPELKGTILDIETKQPLEGAAVVAVYKKATLGLGAGSLSSIIHIRETLTDKDGNFRIPSYWTLIQPFSWQIPNYVLIYKPGYVRLDMGTWHFIGQELKEEQGGSWPGLTGLRYRLRGRGIVELPLFRTMEERRLSIPLPIGDESDYKKQTIFIRLLNEEQKNLGLSGEYSIQ
jgi:hypothetical protein